MMSPRLPTRSRSERRMTLISDLRVLELAVGALELGLLDVDVLVLDRTRVVTHVERRVVAVAATVTRGARALAGDALGVREQRHLAGELDRAGDVALLLHVVARHAAVADLGAIAHEAGEQVDVLVVDVLDLLDHQRAGLLHVLAGGGVLRGTRPILLASHQCAFGLSIVRDQNGSSSPLKFGPGSPERTALPPPWLDPPPSV